MHHLYKCAENRGAYNVYVTVLNDPRKVNGCKLDMQYNLIVWLSQLMKWEMSDLTPC